MEYQELARSIAEIFKRHDPLALISDPSTNGDEYDAEAQLVAARVTHPSGPAEIKDVVWHVFQRQFGADMAGSLEDWETIAGEIWEATQRTRT